MRGRLRTLGVGSVQARTFHAAALRQLRYFWPGCSANCGGSCSTTSFRRSRALPTAWDCRRRRVGRDLAAEIEWAKASLIGPAAYAEHVAEIGRETPQPADKVAQVFIGLNA